MNALPLGELCNVLDSERKPITKRDRTSGEFPYYGATGILDYVGDYIFDERLVLIGEDGAKWGPGENTAFAATGRYWVNNHAHVIRPDRGKVLDEWIIYYLNFSDLSAFITGLTVPKLNQGKLREIPIPLPSLPEQRRMIAILDEAFAGLATATTNAERNLRNARELFDSYLNSVFTQKGEGWVESKLGNVYDVRDGTHDSPKYESRGRTLVTSKNLREGVLDLDNVKLISERDYLNIIKRSAVHRGDVLFAMIGTVGNPIVVDVEPDFAIKNVALFKMSEAQSGRFLRYFLMTREVKTKMQSEAKGTTQKFVGLGYLREFPISIPPRDRQLRIVASLNDLEEETAKLERIFEKKLDSVSELRQSLLQKAFSGELTSPPSHAIKEAAE